LLLWASNACSGLNEHGELWRDQGKREEARDFLLRYGWFTEGFDTLDLKEAKALLGTLE
jgi:hypothetical protein